MAAPYAVVNTSPPPPYRGGGSYDPTRFQCQSVSLTWAWGSEPASATVGYVSDSPVTRGAAVEIAICGHTFFGLCKTDTPSVSSTGNRRVMEFVDNREFLDWDIVYCCFNKLEDRIVSGRRVKRYWHILPALFNSRKKTYTNAPLTAAQILDYVVGSNKWVTIEDPWSCSYHSDQIAYPVYDIDCMSGKKVKEVLQEISDQQGLVFSLFGQWGLAWARKGTGTSPVFSGFPADSDNRVVGETLSGHPTRIRILGDRNLYQVHNIPMHSDWRAAWQQFYDPQLLTEWMYANGTTRTAVDLGGTPIPAGTAYTAIADSFGSEQVIAHQLALADSLDITVAEFASRYGPALGGAALFRDFRKFAGRSRMDMPAALYIREILFRAFRLPSDFSIHTESGLNVSSDSVAIAGKMLAQVTHDPISGVMNYIATENPDGNGYAIARGYQVGRDMFATLRPDRFNLQQWNDAQDIWQHIEFQIDDGGEEDGKYILFDEPVIRSSDLVTMVDGYGVFNAAPTITVPPVYATLTFEANQFSYVAGSGTRDGVENVAGLGGEFAADYGGAPTELPYADGQTASQKAAVIASTILNQQFAYERGSYSRFPVHDVSGDWPAGTQLTGMIDRVSLEFSASGCVETVELTAESPRYHYVPERDLERTSKFRQLIPGQKELRQEANIARLTAAAISTSPRARKTVSDAFRTIIGSNEPLQKVRIG